MRYFIIIIIILTTAILIAEATKGYFINQDRKNQVFITPDKCDVALAMIDSRKINILKAGHSETFGDHFGDILIERLLGYDSDSRAFLFYGSKMDENTIESSLGLIDRKQVSFIDLKGVNVNMHPSTLVCFQDGKIIVPCGINGVTSAKYFNLDGSLDHEVTFHFSSDFSGSTLKKVLKLRDGKYVISLEVDNGMDAIVLCNSKGIAIKTIANGYNLCYDSASHRVAYTDDIEVGNIVVLDIETDTHWTINADKPPFYKSKRFSENLASIEFAPGGNWILATYYLDGLIRGADKSLYAISISRDKQRWCKLQDYVLKGKWLPIDIESSK